MADVEALAKKARALSIENMVHSKQLESVQASFEAACLAGNGRLAEIYRNQVHTITDHILDNRAAICTIGLLIANS
jgi:hypothetical protein